MDKAESPFWYYGSPTQLTILAAGSAITRNKRLAEAFSHKPTIMSFSYDGTIRHNGIKDGYLYQIDEPISKEDAEMHAEDDRKKRELVDAKNMADSLIYTTEKSVKEAGDKLDESTKSGINQAIENLKKAMEGDNTDEIKRLTDELTQASHKLAESMYAQATQQQQQQQAQAGGATSESGAAGGASQDEEVVDADFEEVQK